MIVLKRFILYGSRGTAPTYGVRVVQQPAYNVAAYRVFDRVIEPIVRPVARVFDRVKPRGDWDAENWDPPRDVRLDLVCYDLSVKNETLLYEFELNKHTYDALKTYDD